MKQRILILLLAGTFLAGGCSSSAPVPISNSSTTQIYALSEVQAANNAQKCWTVINGKVYDLTSFISAHKGGKGNILKLCGIDGTNQFLAQHQGQKKPEAELSSLQIGILK